MQHGKDDKPATKTIKILLKLLAAPNRLTLKQLARHVGLDDNDTSAVRRHIDNIKAAGIDIDFDHHYRYFIRPRPGFKELRYLAPLSDEDKALIKSAIHKNFGSDAEATALSNKLESLYDFQALGLEALRQPELEKINDVEAAIKEKKQVKLINYRSKTSNTMRDRVVEAFAIEPEIGMIRAYDIEAGKLRTSHFMLSRLDRVEILDTPWKYEQEHNLKVSDPFNIVMDRRELVHLKLDVSAYNDLIEGHPQARQFARPAKQKDQYDWQARVNAKYIGLMPFLLANWQGVEVLGPENLKNKLKEEVGRINEKWA
ncbi:MAG: WYL domain-containing protein [Bacteroidota bacterium]